MNEEMRLKMTEENGREKHGKVDGSREKRSRYRHGFYSDSFSPEENRALDSQVRGEFNDEMALAKVNARRLGKILEHYKEMDPHDALLAFNALSNFLGTIQALGRATHQLYQNQTTLEQALAELNDIPEELD